MSFQKKIVNGIEKKNAYKKTIQKISALFGKRFSVGFQADINYFLAR